MASKLRDIFPIYLLKWIRLELLKRYSKLTKNGFVQKLNSDIVNGFSFKRINQNRNNQNATKLAEKYTNLAKEALTNGDKILYENYMQHADHFTRIFEEKENNKTAVEKSTENNYSE